jgi:hypothetical protein
MKTDKETEPVEIFSGTSMQVGLVKSLLDNAEIEAFVKDEVLGTLTSLGGAGPSSIFVSNLDYDNAKAIVDEYERNIKDSDQKTVYDTDLE